VALDDLGLIPSLRALIRDMGGAGTGVEITFDAPPELSGLPPDGELALYRTLQEALANAIRHGGAGPVEIQVARERGGVRLTVADHGPGFPAEVRASGGGSRSGLGGIRERVTGLGGEVELGSGPTGGARLRVWIPTDPGGAAMDEHE
jgi:signal transduction histidine kinase